MSTITDDKNKFMFISNLTTELIQLISKELEKPDNQQQIRKKIIQPLINIIYHEIYPFIYVLVIIIVIIMIFTFLILLGMLYVYFKEL